MYVTITICKTYGKKFKYGGVVGTMRNNDTNRITAIQAQ